jgi:hypothetical protein
MFCRVLLQIKQRQQQINCIGLGNSALPRVFILDVSKNFFCCLTTSVEAILEPLKLQFLFVASDSVIGKASKLQPQEKKEARCWRISVRGPWFSFVFFVQ